MICHSRDTPETFCSEKPSVAIILRLSEKWPQNDWTRKSSRQGGVDPSKHEIFNHCRYSVGPPSSTLAQHWVNFSGLMGVKEKSQCIQNLGDTCIYHMFCRIFIIITIIFI